MDIDKNKKQPIQLKWVKNNRKTRDAHFFFYFVLMILVFRFIFIRFPSFNYNCIASVFSYNICVMSVFGDRCEVSVIRSKCVYVNEKCINSYYTIANRLIFIYAPLIHFILMDRIMTHWFVIGMKLNDEIENRRIVNCEFVQNENINLLTCLLAFYIFIPYHRCGVCCSSFPLEWHTASSKRWVVRIVFAHFIYTHFFFEF